MNQYRVLKYQSKEIPGANETLNSPAIATEAYNHIRGKVFSDASGRLNHQQSDDGIIWDTLYDQVVLANNVIKFDEICYTAFYRAQFVTDASAATVFRLSVYADPYST